MRLGNFSAVLERLGDDLDFDTDGVSLRAPDGPWRSSDQVQYAFDNIPGANECMPPDRAARFYGDAPGGGANASGEAKAGGAEAGASAGTANRAKPAATPPRKKSEAESVAEELNLEAARTIADIRRARRKFALHNHPDRVPLANRDEATRRMTIANALIDRALKQQGH